MKNKLVITQIFILFSFLFIQSSFLSAQNNIPSIQVLSKVQDGKVTLRFAPSSPDLWRLGNQFGYKVERFSLSDSSNSIPKGEVLIENLKPLSKNDLETLIQKDERAEVLYEAIYGEKIENFQDGNISSLLRSNQEQEAIFSLALFVCDLAPELAQSAGLWLEDQANSQTSNRFVYRIQLAQVPTGYSYHPGTVVINLNEQAKPLIAPDKLQADFKDQKVTLSWPIFLHRGIYSAYIIEKSNDGKEFKAVNDIPYIYSQELEDNPNQAFFVDSLAENNKIYYYRIKGISPFGEIGPPSEIVSGKGQEDVSALLIIKEAKVLENGQVLIHWDFPDDKASQFQGYQVLRGRQAKGAYEAIHEKILPLSQKSFEDRPTAQNNYYQVRLLGQEGEEITRSFPYLVQLEDSIPPTIPSELKGEVDSLGTAHISWKMNKEADLLGYRVFKANDLQEEFTEITKFILPTPIFKDSLLLDNLSAKVYYQVTAVDRNYNNSEYSEVLTLERPDTIAPVPAIFSSVNLLGDTIQLNWSDSPSLDISHYILLRKAETDTLWQSIDEWQGSLSDSIYSDYNDLKDGKNYQYQLQSIDQSNNMARSYSKIIPYWKTKAQENLKLKGRFEHGHIVLSWDMDENLDHCVIYRSQSQSPMLTYQVLKGNPKKFIDKNVKVETDYQYQVRFYFKDIPASPFSSVLQMSR